MEKKQKTKVIWLGILTVLLVLMVNVAIWLQTSIFNEQKFVQTTQTVLSQESTRNAIASNIVDNALQNYPTVDKVLGDTLTKSVSALMNTNAFASLTTKASTQLYNLVTTKNPQSVVINTSNIQDFLNAITRFVSPATAEKVQSIQIPNQIVLVNANQLPSLYNWTYFVSLWPILGAVALGLAIYLVMMVQDKSKYQVFEILGAELAAAALLFVLLIPAIEPPVIQNISNANMRLVFGSVYSILSQSLVTQTWAIIGAGVLMVGGGWGWNYYQKRQLAKATEAKTAAKTNGRAKK